jgi:hypothetical protein
VKKLNLRFRKKNKLEWILFAASVLLALSGFLALIILVFDEGVGGGGNSGRRLGNVVPIMDDATLQLQDASNVNGIAGIALVLMVLLTLALPRRFALSPLLMMIGLMPLGQQLVVAGLHFTLVRVLLVSGIVRIFVRRETSAIRWTGTDSLMIWWTIVTMVFGSMLFGFGGSPADHESIWALFVNRSGDVFNASMGYFFVRCVVRDYADILTGIKTLAIVSVPIAILMIIEKVTAHNLLSVFGGIPEITQMREGHLRGQGAFRHPILAGTFGATATPLFIALWFCRTKDRFLSVVGTLSGLVITYTATSSGALIALVGGIGGLFMWNHREKLSLLRKSSVVVVIILSVVMQAPVWYVIAKASNLSGGGQGWHRAYLIDQAVSHFNEWYLFGTTYTAHWGPSGQVIAANPNMMDITNHYVMEGVKGGILKLFFFVALIVSSFRRIGAILRSLALPRGPAAFLVWTLGVSLFGHCLSFWSITYFDQLIIVWFWLIAVISSVPISNPALSQPLRKYPNETRKPTPRPFFSVPRA